MSHHVDLKSLAGRRGHVLLWFICVLPSAQRWNAFPGLKAVRENPRLWRQCLCSMKIWPLYDLQSSILLWKSVSSPALGPILSSSRSVLFLWVSSVTHHPGSPIGPKVGPQALSPLSTSLLPVCHINPFLPSACFLPTPTPRLWTLGHRPLPGFWAMCKFL